MPCGRYRLEQSEDATAWQPFGEPLEGLSGPVAVGVGAAPDSRRCFRLRVMDIE
jgi:hypothetical protein